MRRYEVDSIRSIALLLLIAYHIVISFILETIEISFIVNPEGADGFTGILIWFSQAINIWRLPILFLIAGMALKFSSDRRTIRKLFNERTIRILVPLLFCSIFIVPLQSLVFSRFYNKEFFWFPNPGYLWFLFSIFVYVILTLPIVYIIKNKSDNLQFKFIKKILKIPFGVLVIFAIPLMFLAAVFNPESYAFFVWMPYFGILNPHGFFIGLICFILGFSFALSGDIFWNSVRKIKYFTLIIAIMFFLQRSFLFMFPVFEGNIPVYSLIINNILTAFEASCWMITFAGFASSYFNKSTKLLSYMTLAVYPMYIFHLPIQNFMATFIYPLSIAPILKFFLITSATIFFSLVMFEIIKRIPKFRLFFGIKP